VRIEAEEACWMLARFGEDERREFYLRAGDSVRLEFEGTMRLRLGNAGGVRVILDNEPVELNAVPGQVLNITLP
jgi:cytoskeleton protein RodZ